MPKKIKLTLSEWGGLRQALPETASVDISSIDLKIKLTAKEATRAKTINAIPQAAINLFWNEIKNYPHLFFNSELPSFYEGKKSLNISFKGVDKNEIRLRYGLAAFIACERFNLKTKIKKLINKPTRTEVNEFECIPDVNFENLPIFEENADIYEISANEKIPAALLDQVGHECRLYPSLFKTTNTTQYRDKSTKGLVRIELEFRPCNDRLSNKNPRDSILSQYQLFRKLIIDKYRLKIELLNLQIQTNKRIDSGELKIEPDENTTSTILQRNIVLKTSDSQRPENIEQGTKAEIIYDENMETQSTEQKIDDSTIEIQPIEQISLVDEKPNQEFQALLAQIEQDKEVYADKNNLLQQLLAEEKQKNEEAKNTNNQLHNQILAMQQKNFLEIEQLKKDLENIQQENRQKSNKIFGLEITLQKAQADNKKFENDITQLKTETNQSQQQSQEQISQLNINLENLKEESQKKSHEISDLEKRLQTAQTDINHYQTNIAQLKTDANQAHQQSQEQISQLTIDLENLKEESQEKSNKIYDLEIKLQTARFENKKHEADIVRLKTELDQVKQQNQTHEIEWAELNQKLIETQDKHQRSTNKITELNKELEQLKQDYARKVTKYASQLKEQGKQLAFASSQKTTIEDLLERIDKYEKELESQKADLETKTKEITFLQENLSKANQYLQNSQDLQGKDINSLFTPRDKASLTTQEDPFTWSPGLFPPSPPLSSHDDWEGVEQERRNQNKKRFRDDD